MKTLILLQAGALQNRDMKNEKICCNIAGNSEKICIRILESLRAEMLKYVAPVMDTLSDLSASRANAAILPHDAYPIKLQYACLVKS